MTSSFSFIFLLCLMRNYKPWITPWDPYRMPPVILQVLPRHRYYKKSNVVTVQEKSWIIWYVPEIEVCSCVCQPCQDKWIQCKDDLKKKKKKFIVRKLRMKDHWVENMKLKGKKNPAVTELMGFVNSRCIWHQPLRHVIDTAF